MSATTISEQISALEADRDEWRQVAQEAARMVADAIEQKQELEVAAKAFVESAPKIQARALELVAERDSARRIAVALEQECAAKDVRITEAVGLLEDAVVWTSAAEVNARDYILEALSALRGTE